MCVYSKVATVRGKQTSIQVPCSFPYIHPMSKSQEDFLSYLYSVIHLSRLQNKKGEMGVCVCRSQNTHCNFSGICVSCSCKHLQMVRDPSTSRTAPSQNPLINNSLPLNYIEIFPSSFKIKAILISYGEFYIIPLVSVAFLFRAQ